MNETQNPFAAPGPQARHVSRGAVIAWTIAALALLGVGAVLMLFYQQKAKMERQAQDLRANLQEAAAELLKTSGLVRSNQDLVATLKGQLTEAKKEKEVVGLKARTLEEEMRAQLESRDVAISKLQGRLTVTIVDRVMFDSGEAVLKPDGASVMQKIANLLASHPELKIHVIGHTDNIPIRHSAQERFPSNWELSSARALAAVHFLTEKAGVDPRRVGAVAYGEFRPIADNTTAEGRAKNRRIAITILPEELADPETAAAPPSSPPPLTETNAAPASVPEPSQP